MGRNLTTRAKTSLAIISLFLPVLLAGCGGGGGSTGSGTVTGGPYDTLPTAAAPLGATLAVTTNPNSNTAIFQTLSGAQADVSHLALPVTAAYYRDNTPSVGTWIAEATYTSSQDGGLLMTLYDVSGTVLGSSEITLVKQPNGSYVIHAPATNSVPAGDTPVTAANERSVASASLYVDSLRKDSTPFAQNAGMPFDELGAQLFVQAHPL